MHVWLQGGVILTCSVTVEKTAVGNGASSEKISVLLNRVSRGEESGNQIDVAGLYRQNREAKRREEQFVQESARGRSHGFMNLLR